jgi:hypothetical protein
MQHPETNEYVDCATFGFPGQEGMDAQWLVETSVCFVSQIDTERWNAVVKQYERGLP